MTPSDRLEGEGFVLQLLDELEKSFFAEGMLVLIPWPLALEDAQMASPDTPIDLDLDSNSPTGRPLQLLVPPSDVPGKQGVEA